MARVQGEGDYESARRYNARTRKFVKTSAAADQRATGGVDQGALRKAKSKSRAGGQDARDASLMRKKAGGGTKASGQTTRGGRSGGGRSARAR